MVPHSRIHYPSLVVTVALAAACALWPSAARAQWYPYPFYRYAAPESNVRLVATPKEAAVYVDGFYAGLVDDFDGTLQRLRVTPGEHDITLFLEGYRTVSRKLYLQVNSTLKLQIAMEKLAPGETSEPVSRPAARENPPPAGPPPGQPHSGTPPREPPPQPPGPAATPPAPAAPGGSSVLGTLALRIQPRDTTIVIDGERRPGTQWDEVLLLQLREGTHRIEVEKKGYETFVQELSVRRGETATLDISLVRKSP